MFKNAVVKSFSGLYWLLDVLTPIGQLAARWWVAWIFLKAGILKVMSWQSTLMLFRYEFAVPFLSPEVAAVIGTGAELILPILLIFGLGGRLSITVFFIYNLIAVISYPILWTPDGAAGLANHVNWGLLLALLMFFGAGKLSLDYLIKKWYQKRYNESYKKK